jgi:hypothetical protein
MKIAKLALLAFTATWGMAAMAAAEGLKPFLIAPGHFNISFPDRPSHKSVLDTAWHKNTEIFFSESLARRYIAAYTEYPSGLSRLMTKEFAANPSSNEIKALADEVTVGFNRGFKGKITDQSYGRFKGRPAERCRVDRGDLSCYVMCVLGNKRAYVLAVTMLPTDNDLDSVSQFFETFKLQQTGG